MMLSELLYRHIGKTKFVALQTHYMKKRKEINGENITASFKDVFQTFQPTNKYIPLRAQKEEDPKGIPLERVDFTFLKQTLKRKKIPVDKVLTETNKGIISQLVYLYELEMYELENAIIWALTDENKLDVEQFRAACHDLFQAKHNVANVELTMKQQPTEEKIVEQTKLSKEEQLINRLETISPKELLEDLSIGHNASEQDMRLISDLMVKQGLPAPVMNVLIHYVLLQSDMKLSKAYLEKIAAHWSRMQLKTAKEAMEFARKQAEPQKKQQPRYKQTRRQSNEIIPEWFNERDQKENNESEREVTLTKEQEAEQKELIALLQRHASKNN